jgi:hypothetical protein
VTIPPNETAWDVLERFGLALQQAELAREQVRLALDAVGDALLADAVFWYPGTGDGPEGTGPVALSAGWCRHFTEHLLAEETAPASQIVRAFLDPAAKPSAPWPCSAALVRISKARRSWLGALSFHPRRLFGPTDVKVMLLARRMLLSRRQQAQEQEKLRDALGGLLRCLTGPARPDRVEGPTAEEEAQAASCLVVSNSAPVGTGN